MRRKGEVFVGTFVGSGRQYPTARASPAGRGGITDAVTERSSQQDDIFPAGGVLLPPLHAFEPQEIPPADEVVLGGGGIAAAGGAAEAGVEHTPPVPAIGGCADVDAQGLIPPRRAGPRQSSGWCRSTFPPDTPAPVQNCRARPARCGRPAAARTDGPQPSGGRRAGLPPGRPCPDTRARRPARPACRSGRRWCRWQRECGAAECRRQARLRCRAGCGPSPAGPADRCRARAHR